MSPGAVVAVGAWSAFVALVAYGLICDARRWRRARCECQQGLKRADRALERLREVYEPDRLLAECERLYELPCSREHND